MDQRITCQAGRAGAEGLVVLGQADGVGAALAYSARIWMKENMDYLTI